MSSPHTSSMSRRSGKRKRAISTGVAISRGALPSFLPYDSINPFSRSPSERRQVSLAGLKDDEEDPTRGIKDFPHRGIDFVATREAEGGEVEDADDGEEVDKLRHELSASYGKHGKNNRRASPADSDNQLDVLVRSLHQLLDDGKILRAARLFSIILQLRPGSKHMDIRQHNLWAIGAEIIMREGEENVSARHAPDISHEPAGQQIKPDGQQLYTYIKVPVGWGSPANVAKLTAYFDTLIQRYPYDHRFPRNISALDFQLAMFGCEIYGCHTEFMAHFVYTNYVSSPGIERSSTGHLLPFQEFMGADQADLAYANDNDLALPDRKEQAKLQAYVKMRDIAKRMDTMINELPYSKNNHFHQLRATAALFTADLLVLVGQASTSRQAEREQERQVQKHIAESSLHKIEDNGGQIDRALLHMLVDSSGSEPSTPLRPIYASLPIRGT